jgi:hypothetical protein
MEPAAEGGSTPTAIVGRYITEQPQWSPPLDGGSTTNTEQPLDMMLPQWGPPLNDGAPETSAWNSCRNRLPQWCPPLKGGSTAHLDIVPDVRPSAQWSPPLHGGSTREPLV